MSSMHRNRACALLLALAACQAPPRHDLSEVQLVLDVVP